MSPQMTDAIRKEAFVQGFIRARAMSGGRTLADYSDEELLSWLPLADAAYLAYRAERTLTP